MSSMLNTRTFSIDVQNTPDNLVLRSIVLSVANKYLDLRPDMNTISSVTLSDLFVLIDTIAAAKRKRDVQQLSPVTERKSDLPPPRAWLSSTTEECHKAGIHDQTRIDAILSVKWGMHNLPAGVGRVAVSSAAARGESC